MPAPQTAPPMSLAGSSTDQTAAAQAAQEAALQTAAAQAAAAPQSFAPNREPERRWWKIHHQQHLKQASRKPANCTTSTSSNDRTEPEHGNQTELTPDAVTRSSQPLRKSNRRLADNATVIREAGDRVRVAVELQELRDAYATLPKAAREARNDAQAELYAIANRRHHRPTGAARSVHKVQRLYAECAASQTMSPISTDRPAAEDRRLAEGGNQECNPWHHRRSRCEHPLRAAALRQDRLRCRAGGRTLPGAGGARRTLRQLPADWGGHDSYAVRVRVALAGYTVLGDEEN